MCKDPFLWDTILNGVLLFASIFPFLFAKVLEDARRDWDSRCGRIFHTGVFTGCFMYTSFAFGFMLAFLGGVNTMSQMVN